MSIVFISFSALLRKLDSDKPPIEFRGHDADFSTQITTAALLVNSNFPEHTTDITWNSQPFDVALKVKGNFPLIFDEAYHETSTAFELIITVGIRRDNVILSCRFPRLGPILDTSDGRMKFHALHTGEPIVVKYRGTANQS